MIHSPQSKTRKTNSTKSEHSQCSTVVSANQENQLILTCQLFEEMCLDQSLSIRYSQIKLIMALNTLYRTTKKYKDIKLSRYFNVLKNYQKFNKQIENSQAHKYSLIESITKIYYRKAFEQIKIKLKIYKGLKKLFRVIKTRVILLKFSVLMQFGSQKQNEKSCFIDNLSYISLRKKQFLSYQEKLAMQFASTNLIIYTINKIAIKQKLKFFFNLNKVSCEDSVSSLALSPNVKVNQYESPEKKFRAACLLNSILKNKIKSFLSALKIQKVQPRVSFTQSIMQSRSMIFSKLLRSKESDFQQSTNDTTQTKLDQDEELDIFQKPKMTQTLIIKNRNYEQHRVYSLLKLEKISEEPTKQVKKTKKYCLLKTLWLVLLVMLALKISF